MARIFITGSADGLGKMAASLLLTDKHEVYLHARNQRRANDAMKANPGAAGVLTADLSLLHDMKKLAGDANAIGRFDAVIHNAAIGYRESGRKETVDGLSELFAINSLAPYVLTSLMQPPKRLIYLSSGLHRQGSPDMDDLNWTKRRWSGINAYSDSKLHDVILAFAVARLWPDTLSNALEPGWVATKMGGAGAPDSLEEGPKTQVWLAVSKDPAAMASGGYFYHQRPAKAAAIASDPELQDLFLQRCEEFSGIRFPPANAESTSSHQ